MNNNNLFKYLKIMIIIIIICLFIWFLLIKPRYTFIQYEKTLEKAAKRYYEINSNKLPTGKRISTVSVQELFQKSYLEKDMFIPYSKKPCSSTNSWIKVKKDSKTNEYKYYVYLECGALKSNIDHEGPIITLNGNKDEEIEVGTNYKDPGIKSVIDKEDGEKDIKEVIIEGKVNTKKPGIYKIRYTAYDSFNNKTTITRNVTVVKTAYSEIKKKLGTEDIFTGNPNNNYINLSKMDFRIVGVDDKDNIIVVSEDSISYINGNKIDDWINDYYYKTLSNRTKKMIVEKKYCNKVDNVNSKKCSGYTDNKKIYIPSISDVNRASNGIDNYMINDNYTWLSEKKGNERYTINNRENLITNNNKTIQSIRPMFTINGKEKIIAGSGTKDNPYLLKDFNKLTADDTVSKMQPGDIINDKGTKWRVIKIEENDYVKVINENSIIKGGVREKAVDLQFQYKKYDPTNKDSRAYQINNLPTKSLDTKILSKYDIEVPIYEKNIIYGKEKKYNNYKVLLAAPNIFELYSAQNEEDYVSYWFINSSKASNIAPHIEGNYKIMEETYYGKECNIKVTGYISKNKKIESGNGLRKHPYVIG